MVLWPRSVLRALGGVNPAGCAIWIINAAALTRYKHGTSYSVVRILGQYRSISKWRDGTPFFIKRNRAAFAWALPIKNCGCPIYRRWRRGHGGSLFICIQICSIVSCTCKNSSIAIHNKELSITKYRAIATVRHLWSFMHSRISVASLRLAEP